MMMNCPYKEHDAEVDGAVVQTATFACQDLFRNGTIDGNTGTSCKDLDFT